MQEVLFFPGELYNFLGNAVIKRFIFLGCFHYEKPAIFQYFLSPFISKGKFHSHCFDLHVLSLEALSPAIWVSILRSRKSLFAPELNAAFLKNEIFNSHSSEKY